MKSEEKHIFWAKWLIGTVIAIIGAGGGIVAILKYVSDKEHMAEHEYRNAIEAWEKFSPISLSLSPQQIDIVAGECVDLNLGRTESVDPFDSKLDLCFQWWQFKDFYALSTQANIGVAELGVVNFLEIRYRTLEEAPFVLLEKYQNYVPHLFGWSPKSERPPPGFVYVLKLPTNHIAKVQIVEYGEKMKHGKLPNSSMLYPYVRILYEVFPIVAIPPEPKRSEFK